MSINLTNHPHRDEILQLWSGTTADRALARDLIHGRRVITTSMGSTERSGFVPSPRTAPAAAPTPTVPSRADFLKRHEETSHDAEDHRQLLDLFDRGGSAAETAWNIVRQRTPRAERERHQAPVASPSSRYAGASAADLYADFERDLARRDAMTPAQREAEELATLNAEFDRAIATTRAAQEAHEREMAPIVRQAEAADRERQAKWDAEKAARDADPHQRLWREFEAELRGSR